MAEGIVPFQNLAKQQLLERCRELEFVDDIEFLKCTRCNRLALEHWYTNCGHALCPNCKRLLSGWGFKCPQCDQFIQHIEEQSADFEAKVNGLHANCPNSRYGCTLVTTVKQLQEHLHFCEWTKEQALPTVYKGINTTEMLLEEVSKLKMQIGDMHGTIGFLLNELHKRQEVEDDIKKSVEMSVADIKSRLNGLSSDLHFETSTLKAQAKNINLEQLQIQFSSKEEVKQQEQQLSKLDGKTNALFQMLDEKVDKFSQRLSKEIENINVKIKVSEDKVEVMRNEDKIRMNQFKQEQITVFENYKQELFANNKDLQGKVEKSNDDFKMALHKLRSELTLELEQGKSFGQNESEVKMEVLTSELKKQEAVLMKQIHEKTKDFVSKEKLKQLQETVAEMKVSSKLLIQMLDQKEDRFNQKITKEVEAIDAKIVTSGAKMKDSVRKVRQETAAISKDLQSKVEKSSEDLEAQWQKLSSDLNQRVEQKEIDFSQKLSNEVKQLDEKFKVLENQMRCKEEEIDNKMGFRFEKQEMAVENCRKEMASFSEIEIETKKLNNEIDHLKLKTNELEKKLNWVSKLFSVDVKTIQKLNPRLSLIETFKEVIAIEELMDRKSSVQQLVDSFLFGSAEEQMAFESLCLKWTIKCKNINIPKKGEEEHLSKVFPVYGFQLEAQLLLTIDSDGASRLELCFLDGEREGQEVDIKLLPMVTYIIKDVSKDNNHLIRCCHYSLNPSLQYNEFGYWSDWIGKSQWTALIAPYDSSLKVLVLVEPPAIIHKPLSLDGTITDTIEHYSRKLQMAKEGLIGGHMSPPFLTHVGGYRVAVKMALVAPFNKNKTGLVAMLFFLSGEHKSQLGVEFEHETSVTLINQSDAEKNITVKQHEKGVANSDILHYFLNRPIYGYDMVIASEDAIGSGFLINDSLTYCVTIKPIKK